MTTTNISHVIFDLDGLLLDTEPLYTVGIQNVLNKFNAIFTWDVKEKMMGKSSMDASTCIVKELNLPVSPEKFLELAEEQYKIVLCTAELMPGAERLVRHLHKHKVPIAIATGSDINSYKLKTEKHEDFFNLFHHVVTISSDPEVKHGKPAPDAFIVCASRFIEKPSSDKVIVFEDAPLGVESALAAGMKVIMVPDERLVKSKISEKVTILKSLKEFQPEQFGLPMYNGD